MNFKKHFFAFINSGLCLTILCLIPVVFIACSFCGELTPNRPIIDAAPQWNYTTESDPGSQGYIHTAEVSTNTGMQSLQLRTHPRLGNDAIVSIEKGKFLCHDGCTVLVRFDDGTAIRYSATSTLDGNPIKIVILGYSNFVRHLENSYRVRISAHVYQEGSPVFDFDVSSFDATKYEPERISK